MDRQGRAKNAAGRSYVRPAARRAAGAIADAFVDRLGDDLHSVYLTGPAARGREGPLRVFGVLRLTAEPGSTVWLAPIAGAVRARWPKAGMPELSLYPWRDVFPVDDTFSLPRFRLGVNSICIAGRNLASSVAPQPPSIAAANAWIISVTDRVSEAASRMSLAASETDLSHEAEALSRFLLEAGFALVMAHEGVYTEDLDVQRDLFSLNYPERADDAARAHRFAVDPSSATANDVFQLIDGFGRWMNVAAKQWLDAHNPSRLPALAG